jgi:enterochelin esterase-like enzyme
VVATAARTGVFGHDLDLVTSFRYGYSARALSMGHYGTVWTSQFLSRDAFMAVSMSLSLALMLGVYEMVAGSWRALVVTVASALSGLLLVSGGLAIGAVLGSQFASRTLSTLDYGGSAVTAGGGGALVAVLGMRRLRWFAVFWVALGLVAHHQIADWEHLCAFVTGYGVGHLLGVPDATTRGRAHVGTRMLVAAALVLAIVLGAGVAGATVPSGTGLTAAHHRFRVPTLHRRTTTSTTAVASPPRIVPISYPTPALGGTKSGYVVLPPGYDRTHVRYPVVEMLHGRPGSPNDVITGLDPVGAEYLPGVPPFIGVVPDGHGPRVYDGEYADTSKQQLGTALSDNLRAWIDAHYRTNGDWTITGLSSGGYGAAYLASRPEGGYAAACPMSGNFVPESAAFAGQSRAVIVADTPLLHARANGPRMLLVAGTRERESIRQAQAYDRALTAAGEPARIEILPGGHDWAMWGHGFADCLRFLLQPPAP